MSTPTSFGPVIYCNITLILTHCVHLLVHIVIIES